MPNNTAQRLRHFQRMVKQKQQQMLGINPNLIKPRVFTKVERRAQKRLKVPQGTTALMTLREGVTSEQSSSARARAILGEGEEGRINSSTALSKTPLNRAELKQRLFLGARMVGEKRRAQNRVTQLTEELKVLTKTKSHLVMVAMAGDLFKLNKLSLPKLDIPLLRRMVKDNPKLRSLSKLLEYEMTFERTEANQQLMYQRVLSGQLPQVGEVIQKGKGFVVTKIDGKNGVTKRLIFSSYNGIRSENKKRAYAISKVINGLKKDLLIAKKEASREVNQTEVLENTRPLVQAYRLMGKEELTLEARKGIYNSFKEKEDAQQKAVIEKEQKIRAAELAKRVAPLKNAQRSIYSIMEAYERLASSNSFSEAATKMNSAQVLINLFAEEYTRALRTYPELENLAALESVQLLIPDSEMDMIRTIERNGLKLKKVRGKAVLVREGDRIFLMPTTVEAMKGLAQHRVDEMLKAISVLEGKVALESGK